MVTLLNALADVQSYLAWPGPALMAIGIVIGTVFGILPGLAGPQAIVLLLPLTINLKLNEALILLISTQAATFFAGSLTSILVGIPGTAVNAATILDGYPLARQGKAGYAIGASGGASAFGGVLGAVVLLLLIPLAPAVILSFSYQEFSVLGLLGISMISMMGGKRTKGVIAAGVGLLLGAVGYDPLVSVTRFSFGVTYLWDGIGIIPTAIGLFGISEAIDLLIKRKAVAQGEFVSGIKGIWKGIISVFQHFFVFMKGTLIGVFVGIIPGIGASVAQFVAYASSKSGAKDQSRFGSGDIRGVIGPEASNNAKEGGSLVPTLFFGIPGSVDTAIMLGVFTIHGVSPGLRMLTETPEIPAAVIMALAIANVASVAFGFLLAPQLIKLTKIPGSILGAPILAFAILGSYAADGRYGDVIVTFLFGILGYYMSRAGFSKVCLIIGLLLGNIVERNFRQALMIAGIDKFFTRPVSLSLIIFLVIFILWPLFRKKAKRQYDQAAVESGGEAIIEKMVMNILFLAIGIGCLTLSLSYRFGSGAFPFAIAVIVVVFATFNIIAEWQTFKKMPEAKEALPAGQQTVRKVEAIYGFLWLLALVVALGFINYIWAIAAFNFFILKLFAKQSWTRSIAIAAAVGGFIYVIFDLILQTTNL